MSVQKVHVCDDCGSIIENEFERIALAGSCSIQSFPDLDFCDLFCMMHYLDKLIRIRYAEIGSDAARTFEAMRYKRYMESVPEMEIRKAEKVKPGIRKLDIED